MKLSKNNIPKLLKSKYQSRKRYKKNLKNIRAKIEVIREIHLGKIKLLILDKNL